MVRMRTVMLALLIGAGFSVTCSRQDIQYKNMTYYPAYDLPQKVYVDDQVDPLRTNGPIQEPRRIFVEVRTREGRQEKGKLLEITDQDLIMCTEFRYEGADETSGRVETEVTIPKEDILILKIF